MVQPKAKKAALIEHQICPTPRLIWAVTVRHIWLARARLEAQLGCCQCYARCGTDVPPLADEWRRKRAQCDAIVELVRPQPIRGLSISRSTLALAPT